LEDLKPIVFARFNTRRGKAKSITIKCLLDTGASGSFIASKHSTHLKLHKDSNPTVTWSTADGTLLTFTAGPDVRNLAQVKVGDVVTLSHTVALVLELKKTSGGIRERVESEGGLRAAPGQMPGAVMAREVRVVADVTKIDTKNKTVTLRGPKRSMKLRVDDPKQLAGIKLGDQVEATFIDAVAVTVEHSPKSK